VTRSPSTRQIVTLFSGSVVTMARPSALTFWAIADGDSVGTGSWPGNAIGSAV
jgi:hypothetical protein